MDLFQLSMREVKRLEASAQTRVYDMKLDGLVVVPNEEGGFELMTMGRRTVVLLRVVDGVIQPCSDIHQPLPWFTDLYCDINPTRSKVYRSSAPHGSRIVTVNLTAACVTVFCCVLKRYPSAST